MIAITVYKDTIIEHDEIDNLAEIYVTEEFAEQYFNKFQKLDNNDTFEDWLNTYTADNTMDLYWYAKEHNAILKMEY